MSTAPAPRRALVAATLAAALLAAACGDDSAGGENGDDVDDPAAAAAAALDGGAGPDSGTADDTEAGDESEQLDPTTIPGEIVDKYSLEIDDCFDQLEDLRAGRPVTITTLLPCDDPHHFQVYARLTYPAPHPSTVPGDNVMADYALRECYLEFPAWVGTSYELSDLEIGVITPTLENFENSQSRYRGIHCWVEHVDGEALVGSMRGSAR